MSESENRNRLSKTEMASVNHLEAINPSGNGDGGGPMNGDEKLEVETPDEERVTAKAWVCVFVSN